MNDHLLWFATRGAGVVSLILLTTTTVLGLMARMRIEGRSWPRFLTARMHADLALMTLTFVTMHIVTAVVDPFTHLGLTAATIPFGSYYRTFWLGLGTIAFELMLAITITSLVRRALGTRAWRRVHWLAYATWPVAVAHGLGTGTDTSTAWMAGVNAVCIAAVAAAVVWRTAAAPSDPLRAERDAAMRSASITVRG